VIALDCVDTITDVLDNSYCTDAGINHVDVVPCATDEDIGSSVCGGKRVVSRVSGDDVVERVAGGIDIARAGQGQIFQIRTERIAKRCQHRVGAFAGALGRVITGYIYNVCVIAETSDQLVGSRATIEHVVSGISGEGIGR